MEININDAKKIVEVWLTKSEKQNTDQLGELFDNFHQRKYTVVVFESGDEELFPNTLSLLSYNKKKIAELTALQEKKAT